MVGARRELAGQFVGFQVVVVVDEDAAAEHAQDGVPAGQDALVADPDAARHTQGDEVRGKARRFDRKLLHVAANGTPMASKNEVIIAGLLDQLVPGRWQYEQPLVGSDGREVLPDFTIAAPDGRTVYWEHAGMLDLPDYARKWELKKPWYADNGILPADDGGGANGVLMWTDDLQGADAQAWLAHAAQVLGSNTFSDGDPAPATPARRATKKTAKRTP